MVVLSVVVAGAFFTVVDCVVVVVVVGAGVSTTVVHEVKSTAAIASKGVRIISFFIVGVVSFKDDSVQAFRPDVFRAKFGPDFRTPGSSDGALDPP